MGADKTVIGKAVRIPLGKNGKAAKQKKNKERKKLLELMRMSTAEPMGDKSWK